MSELQNSAGVRPVAAFACLAGVLAVVAGKSAWIALAEEGEQPDGWAKVDAAPPQNFHLVDRAGRTLGVSIECFDLHVSPRAMWLAHTPRRIARELAILLGEEPQAILERLLPPAQKGSVPGIYKVENPRLLRFDERTAGRIQRWIRSGATSEHDGGGSLRGIELIPLEEDSYTLCIQPAELLSAEQRERQLPASAKRPSRWTRRLLNDLIELIDWSAHRDLEPLKGLPEGAEGLRNVREELREALWAELMPCQHRVLARRVDPVVARRVTELREREAVSSFQLDLVPVRERQHPLRPSGSASFDPAKRTRDDAFSLLGNWGVVPAETSLDVAQGRLGELPADHPDVIALRHRLETEWRPWSGLERVAYEMLQLPSWAALLQEGTRGYLHRRRSTPRDRHAGWRALDPDRRLNVPDYYGVDQSSVVEPTVVCSLDATLQHYLHGRLEQLMGEHDPALAMGIVVDVESAQVLAVDGIYAYEVSGFAPLTHAFTPGSTFKAIVMAAALDDGKVTPEEEFETFAGSGIVVRDGRTARRIGEAEGAPTEAWISATDGLAESVNAVLVQIGLRMDASALRGRLAALGYGRRPGLELGPRLGGMLPRLEKGTWTRAYTHASVCFGHEVAVTLWQHAAALATVARGGEYRELSVIERVEQNGRAWQPDPGPAQRVFSEAACETTLAMLAEGARRGTGEPVAGPDYCPEFEYIGTKTGTTEKKNTELCLHVEWPHAVEHARKALAGEGDGRTWKQRREELRFQTDHRPGRQSCYTSSMLAIGRLPGDERTLLTLVVVEDSRSKARFGRDVSGQAAIDILRRAFALAPRDTGDAASAPVASLPAEGMRSDSDLPWLEDARKGEDHVH